MDKAKKKQVKKAVTWALLAALVAGLAAMPLLAKAEAEADGPVATVHSGTVEEGSVRTTLHGGGTLHTEGIEEVNLPSGVKITEFLVKNGDVVTEGTPLAAVDKVSVMTAITSVTETMEYLQEEMKSAKNEKVSSTVAATAGGRIKKVYAQKGDSVQDVMLRDGALALLSLDGLMAVEIEKKLDILTGDTVTVTLADGEEVTGRIASNLDGVIVITLEDAGYEIGQTVTVTGKDGSEVGSGDLYVHNAWTASAFSGIIQNVLAKEETKVSAGSTLFTLTETDFRGKLEYLSSLHREYEDLMQDLFKMYNSGTIDAPCDGTISGVDKDSAHLLSAEEGHWQITLLNHTPVQTFAAFSAQVTAVGSEGMRLSINPNLIRLESLYNLRDIPANDTAMTQNRTYPAETEIYTQNASGALIPGGTAATGDRLLFIGDESGVLWVVNLAQSVSTVGYTPGNVRLELLSDGEPPAQPDANSNPDACTQNEDCPAAKNAHEQDCPKACKSANTDEGCTADDHYLTCIHSCDSAEKLTECNATLHHYRNCILRCNPQNPDCDSDVHQLSCIKSCNPRSQFCPATDKHQTSCIKSCIQANLDGASCPADPNHYNDCIEACIESDSGSVECPATKHKNGCVFAGMDYEAKVALVAQVGKDDLIVRWDSSHQNYEVEKTATGWKFSNNFNFNTDLLVETGTISVSNPSAYQPGDVIFVVTGYDQNDNAVWTGIPVFMRLSVSSVPDVDINLDGLLGGLTGMLMPDLSSLLAGFGNFGFYAPSPVEEDKLFDLEGSTLMTVSPQKTISLTITLDEQDIAKVSVGQKATVKVEALSGETFEAVVTEVSNHGANSGGSSKYTAKLELPKAKDMLDGMSATATLPLLEKEAVPTIPVVALVDLGTQTVVYTALDDEGTPTNPVPVTIGLSDGTNAELIEGLTKGATYYYSTYDVLKEDTSVEDRFTLR